MRCKSNIIKMGNISFVSKNSTLVLANKGNIKYNGEAQPSIRQVLRFIMMFMYVYKRERCDKSIFGITFFKG